MRAALLALFFAEFVTTSPNRLLSTDEVTVEHGKTYANGTTVIWDLRNPDAPPRIIEPTMELLEEVPTGELWLMRRGRRGDP